MIRLYVINKGYKASLSYILITYVMLLLFALPLSLTTGYFSKEFGYGVSIITLLLFFIAYFTNIFKLYLYSYFSALYLCIVLMQIGSILVFYGQLGLSIYGYIHLLIILLLLAYDAFFSKEIKKMRRYTSKHVVSSLKHATVLFKNRCTIKYEDFLNYFTEESRKEKEKSLTYRIGWYLLLAVLPLGLFTGNGLLLAKILPDDFLPIFGSFVSIILSLFILGLTPITVAFSRAKAIQEFEKKLGKNIKLEDLPVYEEKK